MVIAKALRVYTISDQLDIWFELWKGVYNFYFMIEGPGDRGGGRILYILISRTGLDDYYRLLCCVDGAVG